MGKMAKSKNHTSHNQIYKNHRNGIFRPKQQRHVSNDMVNQKLIRNTRRARKYDPSIIKQKTLTRKIEGRRAIKAKVVAKVKELRANKLLGLKPKKVAAAKALAAKNDAAKKKGKK